MGVLAGMVISGEFCDFHGNKSKNSVFSSLQKILSLTFLLVLYKACNK